MSFFSSLISESFLCVSWSLYDFQNALFFEIFSCSCYQSEFLDLQSVKASLYLVECFSVQNSLDAYKPLLVNFTSVTIVPSFREGEKSKIAKLKLCIDCAMLVNCPKSER